MHPVLKRISEIGIVPVIKIDEAEKAVPLARALCAGGIPVAEVTFRTAQAEAAIRAIAEQVPEMLVGAGTVLTTEQADRAQAAGAQFIVSPGLNPAVAEHCVKRGIPVTPGCASPSDIERALELGITTVKFFPAEAAGGLAMIKAMAAPYRAVTFIPTGGINAENLNSYLAFPKVLACGGSWMVSDALISAGDFERITQLAREAVDKMLGFSLVHIGINTDSEPEALASAEMFSRLLGPVKNGNSSVFAGSAVEMMKSPGRGKNGHIAVGTPSVERAAAHLALRGIALDPDSAKFGSDGRMTVIFFAEEIAGFAVHLIEKK